MTALAAGEDCGSVAALGPDPAHRDDYALAAGVGAGDPVASERFVRRALKTVRRVARAILADRTEADDAIQLALLDLLGAAKTYRGTGSFDGWVRRIASRAVLRYARKARSSRLRTAAIQERSAPGRIVMDATVLESLPRSLEYYLGALPKVQRTAILLRHALGHTVGEIAEVTDAPVPTVRSRIKKAQQQLRRLIQRDLNIGTARKAENS